MNIEDDFKQTPYDKSKICQITERSQEEILSSLPQFYGLMTLAHYRTSPLDLRRLFDANSQCFTAENEQNLLGAVWALKKAGIEDSSLIGLLSKALDAQRHLCPASTLFSCSTTKGL